MVGQKTKKRTVANSSKSKRATPWDKVLKKAFQQYNPLHALVALATDAATRNEPLENGLGYQRCEKESQERYKEIMTELKGHGLSPNYVDCFLAYICDQIKTDDNKWFRSKPLSKKKHHPLLVRLADDLREFRKIWADHTAPCFEFEISSQTIPRYKLGQYIKDMMNVVKAYEKEAKKGIRPAQKQKTYNIMILVLFLVLHLKGGYETEGAIATLDELLALFPIGKELKSLKSTIYNTTEQLLEKD